MSRPTISISPSRRTSSARPGSITGSARPAGSVDVVAVPPRADVALRIERLAAQRAGQAPGGHDGQCTIDEAPCVLGREADLERVWAVFVVVGGALERGQELACRGAGQALDLGQID